VNPIKCLAFERAIKARGNHFMPPDGYAMHHGYFPLPCVVNGMQLHAFVSGRVQGVGFRANTEWIATGLGLRGWVRNTGDGYVEVLAEGPRSALDKLLDWLRVGPSAAHVEHVDFQFVDENEGLTSFDVKD